MSRKKVRIAASVAVVFVLALAGIVLSEQARGARELSKVLHRLRSANVEFDLAKVMTNSVPESENAAAALLAITNELRLFSWPENVGAIPAMKYISPGKAQSFVRSEGWPDARDETTRWELLDETHSEAIRLFQKLAESSKRPRFASPLDASKGVADMAIPSLAAIPSTMRVLRVAAMCDLHRGNDARAAEAVITLLDLFANKSEDTWNIAEFARCASTRSAFSMTWELLQNARVSDETWASLQGSWERCEFLASYARAAGMELAAVSDYFARAKDSRTYREHMIDNFELIEREHGGSWNPPVRGILLRRVHLPLWGLLWADQDHAHSMKYRETELLLANFARTNSWTEVRAEASRLGRPNEGYEVSEGEDSLYNRFRFLYSYPPEPLASVDLLRVFKAETEARLATTAIALHRYVSTHKEFPETLEALIPQLLARMPIDPMDGKPLKYQRLEMDDYLLYSSGTDGVNDGGSAEADNETSAPNLWSTADAIWPRRVQPAT